MNKKIIALALLLCITLSVWGCTEKDESYFKITFIDVGQGDSALVECDGHFMLIDSGPSTSGEKVYSVLKENGATKLDYLVISHMHEDHYGGLSRALECVHKIDKVLSNTTEAGDTLIDTLQDWKQRITVPEVDKKYHLGSAKIIVIDNANTDTNDSLVLMIKYGETHFLLTGDIQKNAQSRIVKKYEDNISFLTDIPYKIDVLKMPHHGAYNENVNPNNSTLYRFLWTFMPDHVVFSVGKNNYGHPSQDTLKLLNSPNWQPSPNIYRTDEQGDIVFTSDGKTVTPQR